MIVTSLIELSKYRLSTVIDGIIKSIDAVSVPPPPDEMTSNRVVPLNMIQTNHFLIQLLSVCMQQHWLHFDNASTHPNGIHRQLRDPPPLDSRLAKQVLDLMLRFMYHTSNPSSERATFFTHQMYCYCDREFTKGAWADFTVFMSRLHSTNLMASIYEKTCRVIYYISASNWALVFSKIKSSILHLSTTSEETPDTLMLRLLECSSLNARRLSMALAELQLSFLKFKKNTQLNLAVLLRRGIWNWVEGYPIEFKDLQLDQKRLDGSPEILFDMCSSLADTTRKKTYFWPLQNMLLMLCPDILTNITLNYSHGNYSKKSHFLNGLQLVIRGDHMAEVAAICYTDICLAAYKLPKDSGATLWSLIPNVTLDLEDWLSSPTKPYTHGADMLNAGVILDRKMLMRDADFALLQLAPKHFIDVPYSLRRNVSQPSTMYASRIKVGVLVESELSHQMVLPTKEYRGMGNYTKRTFFTLTSLHQEHLNNPDEVGSSNGSSSKDPASQGNASIMRSKSAMASPLLTVHNDNNNNSNNNNNNNNNNNSNNKSISSSNSSSSGGDIPYGNRADFTEADVVDMIHDILLIIRAQPAYILSCPECANDPGEVAKVIITITTYLNDSSPILSDVAASCLYAIHQPKMIHLWDTSDTFLMTYWEISHQVLLLVSDYILNHRHGKGLGLKRLVNLLKQLLRANIDILVSQTGAPPAEEPYIKIWHQTATALESTLLVLLCSTDDFIYARVNDCIRLLCEEVQIFDNMGEYQFLRSTIYENIGAYMELVTRMDIVPGGRKSHQKRLGQVLRQMTRCTPGNLAAWEEVWRRWKRMTPRITYPENSNTLLDGKQQPQQQQQHIPRDSSASGRRSSISTTSFVQHNSDAISSPTARTGPLTTPKDPSKAVEDPTLEWEYYTGFLSVLAQVCLVPTSEDESHSTVSSSPRFTSPSKDHVRSNPSIDSSHSDMHRNTIGSVLPGANETMADDFVGTMVDLLVCDNLMVRERVREIMGGDLSPSLYWIMIQHFKLYMNACFEQKKPIFDARRILFVDQSISVLRIMLARPESADVLVDVDFVELIGQFCTYITALDDNVTSKKIKIKLCQFCDSLVSQRNQLSIHKDIVVRSILLKTIHRWTSDFDLKATGDTPLWHPGSGLVKSMTLEDNLQVDLDMACLKTMVPVLHQLPLQPTEPTREVDLIQRKSKMFYKYFTFFLKLLDRCKDAEMEVGNDSVTATTSMNRSNIGSFKNNIILCLSNLLSANVDVGLKYSLSMGYHQDVPTRSAFMQVLTNILKQGTEFETLAESVMTDRYRKLVDASTKHEMIFQYDCAIPLSLCNISSASETDNVATALLASFASKGKSLTLLRLLIENEVQQTISESELFRKTSIATRCLTLFAKANGSGYIVSVLKPVMDEIVSWPKDQHCFELDPNNVTFDYCRKNKDNVIRATSLILEAICSSTFMAPACFRAVCNFILESVKTRFPESKYTAVGSFIFLRFFCPVIVSPESAGLVKPGLIDKESRRGLLIIAKVIQNIANNVLFGSKEVYMVVLNDFVTENMYTVTSYLRNMTLVDVTNNDSSSSGSNSDKSSDKPSVPDTGISPQMNETDYRLLHSVLAKNFEKIQHDLATKKLLMFDNQESLTSWNDFMEEFSMVLVQLGPPPENIKNLANFGLQQRYISKVNNSRQYTEFMRSFGNCSTNDMAQKNICYAGGSSMAGHSVMYFIFRRMRLEELDMELLLYYIFQVMENMYGKPFIVVLDATRFGPDNEIPKNRLLQFSELIPKSILAGVPSIIVYNPNTCFRKFLKRSNCPVDPKFAKRITFAITMKELAEYIQPSEVQLPRSTVELEKDPATTTFFPVSRVWQYNFQTPVTIKVSTEYVQIISNRKQEMIPGKLTLTNDVYHISEIQGFSNAGSQASQLSFMSTTDRTMIFLRTPKHNNLLHAMLDSKRKYDASKSSTLSNRIIRPSDVPGRLLNMALLNLGSSDSRLRLAAYNLLYTLCRTFKFKVGAHLLNAQELCIPPNCFKFIAKISGRLAVTEQHLTLEFLNECFIGFDKSTEDQRYLCLHYMTPWIPNLAETSHGTAEEVVKTKEVLRMLISISLKSIHTSIQTKLWRTLGTISTVWDLVIEASVEISKEHGLGSREAEMMADTCVTLSNILVRSKLVAISLRLLRRTTFNPVKSLMDHPHWLDIAVLTRFNLMLSFDNCGPMKNYVPDILHIVTLLVGVGPTLIRTTIHGITINLIQSLCISPKLLDSNRRELQQLMARVGERRVQLNFGLTKPYANAFMINADTLTDPLPEPFDLAVLHTILMQLLRIIEIGAPTTDISNAWRARWMSHITGVVFQPNPAIQPRAFVALGCLGHLRDDDDDDDDLMYQILCSLRRALLKFDPDNPTLVHSITMCLGDVVGNMKGSSRYLAPLFWVALALRSINHPALILHATELVQNVLHAMNAAHMFDAGEMAMKTLLFDTRVSYGDVCYRLDRLNGVNFETHFSFAVVGILMKGMVKEATHQCLLAFLNCATRQAKDTVNETVLGYVTGLVSTARQSRQLWFAGVHWECTDDNDNEDDDTTVATRPTLSSNLETLFEKFDIPDDDTALLFLSCLVAQLQNEMEESERLFLYELLSHSATIMPDVFCSVYPTLLPQINALIASSDSLPLLKALQSILMSAFSDSRFQNPPTLHDQLASLGFSVFEDPTAVTTAARMVEVSSLTSQIVERILQ